MKLFSIFFTLIFTVLIVGSIKIGTSSEMIIENNNENNSNYKEMLLEEEILIAERLEFIQREVEFLKKKKDFIKNEISRIDKNNENTPSSFVELKAKMKADPLFKTMALGFPVPRQISYVGMPNNEQYNQMKYCPAGCVVP